METNTFNKPEAPGGKPTIISILGINEALKLTPGVEKWCTHFEKETDTFLAEIYFEDGLKVEQSFTKDYITEARKKFSTSSGLWDLCYETLGQVFTLRVLYLNTFLKNRSYQKRLT